MNNKILVVGGTGMLGNPVLARLITDGYPVRVMSHDPDRANQIFGGQVEVVFGDVTRPETLKKPMDGIAGVYISLNAKMNLPDYDKIEGEGVANLGMAAKEAGVDHIAMISGLSVGAGHDEYEFIAGKMKGEKALIESGVPYTILRCGWFFESLPLFVTDKQATVFGKQPHKFSWMAAADYTLMVSKVFALDETKNKIFHIRGIEKYTIGEALKGFCEICFPEAKMVTVPFWTVSMVSMFSRKSAMKGVLKFMKYFNTFEEVTETDDAEKILGPALTTLKDWAENYKIKLMTK